jgi:hypothetical protein
VSRDTEPASGPGAYIDTGHGAFFRLLIRTFSDGFFLRAWNP